MPWIKTVPANEAKGMLKKLYDQIRSPGGHVDHIMQIHSLRPRTMRAHLEIYKAALHTKPNALSQRERELVGVVVSILNECTYCVEHHRAGLSGHLGGDHELATELTEAGAGLRPSSNLTAREAAMCAYARKLSEAPGTMSEEDFTPLRKFGLDDAAILDLNQVIAYFAYANRTVLGLGVAIAGEPIGLHPDENEEGFRHK